MPIIRWNLGPDEIECLLTVDIHPAEHPVSGPCVEVVDGYVLQERTHRRLTVEEEGWLEEVEEEIEKAVLSEP